MLNSIPIKTAEDIEKMRRACQVTAIVLDEVGEIVKPGITTEDINSFVHRRILEMGGIPATLNYRGFTKSCCTSINDVVCHGVPSTFVSVKAGDIINIDVTTIKDGFFGDSSRMYMVGGPAACSDEARALIDVTKRAMFAGISAVKPGGKISDIGIAIHEFIDALPEKYGIVREYTGHGIGREFHEPPQVLHFRRKESSHIMRPGMTFTIEPMINEGTHKTILSKVDGWTVRTADGLLSAQWEHTVLVTEDGYELMTESPKGIY